MELNPLHFKKKHLLQIWGENAFWFVGQAIPKELMN